MGHTLQEGFDRCSGKESREVETIDVSTRSRVLLETIAMVVVLNGRRPTQKKGA